MFDLERDPATIPTEHLEHEIAALAAHIYAATCRWLCLIAEFDRRECHLSWGFHSCTAWVAWTCGLTPRAAREHVRVARDLGVLPRIRESFGRGELSYSKVRALTRVAEPATEAELLELAHNATASQLERIVRAYGSAIAVAEGESPPDLYFAWDWEDDGTLSVRGRLAADEGALLIEAMHHGHRIAAGRRGAEFAAGAPQPPPQRNTDALAAVAEASLSSLASGTSTGGDRYQVVVHLDANGRRELEQGSTLGVAAARRVLCDASIVSLVEADGVPVSAGGRRSRTIPAALRRALRGRDRGCRFPGCTHERFVDAHHIEHWADGGETTADNLVQLCRRHHRLIHEGGFGVSRSSGGELEFRDRSGEILRVRPALRRGDPAAIATGRRSAPRQPSGDRLDLDLAVDCLLQRSAQARPERVSENVFSEPPPSIAIASPVT